MRHHAVDSSNIESISYSKKTRMLTVEFASGSIYQYRDVPYAVYLRFLNARKPNGYGSHGEYFAAFIRGKYTFHLLDDPADRSKDLPSAGTGR